MADHLRVFVYDVSNDKRRRKIAERLEAQATRVQHSVFEARLTDIATQNLSEDLAKHLGDGDSLRVYLIGKTGLRHSKVYGKGIPIDEGANYWLF